MKSLVLVLATIWLASAVHSSHRSTKAAAKQYLTENELTHIVFTYKLEKAKLGDPQEVVLDTVIVNNTTPNSIEKTISLFGTESFTREWNIDEEIDIPDTFGSTLEVPSLNDDNWNAFSTDFEPYEDFDFSKTLNFENMFSSDQQVTVPPCSIYSFKLTTEKAAAAVPFKATIYYLDKTSKNVTGTWKGEVHTGSSVGNVTISSHDPKKCLPKIEMEDRIQ